MNCHFRTIAFAFLTVMAACFAVPPHSLATLGESASSVAKDRQALSAVHKATTSKGSYTVQEEVSDATTVREYLDASGTVFAVAWNGRVHPDLTQLLGSYALEFHATKKTLPRKHGQRRLLVKGDNIVVETWGHMRNLQGRAYVPALLPSGINVNDIK